MQLLLRHKLLIGGVALALAASGGAAYAATQSSGTGQQAFINDVAKRLNVSPTQLRSAVKGALVDQLNAEVKAGRLTQAQANKIEQMINQNGQLPLFFAPGPPRLFLAPGLHKSFSVRAKGGVFHAAATYLGLTNAQLLSDLASGKSLAQIANARGKSVSGLEQAIVAAAKTRLDHAVSKGRITKAQEQQLLNGLSAKISGLVNRTGLGLPPASGQAFHAMPGGPMSQKAHMPPNGAFLPGGGPPPGPIALGPNA